MKRIIKNIVSSWKHIPYTLEHYFAVIALQYLYMGKVKYWFHDLDKILMFIFIPFLGPQKIKILHRKLTKHHKIGGQPEESFFDWESARFTKKDKQLNALDTCKNLKKDWWESMKPIFEKYGIIGEIPENVIIFRGKRYCKLCGEEYKENHKCQKN